MKAPPIDTRDRGQLIDRTAQLAQRYSAWRRPADDTPDAGQALIGIFGRFAELVVERINRAPEKNFLAFLNLVGTNLTAPQPARVPVTFTLAEGSPVDGLVPVGTRVAAPPADDETDEVVFETERSLVVTRARLQAVFVADTETDSYGDRTAPATGLVDEPYPAFSGGDRPVPHQLYLACDPLLTGPGTKDVTLALQSPDTMQWTSWPISWSYWDGAAWTSVVPTTARPGQLAAAGGVGAAKVESRTWRLSFRALPQLPKHAVYGVEGGWLRAQLEMPLPPGRSGLPPESVAVGGKAPQDPVTPLFPFGETTPARWFYLSADEAIAPGSALVRIQVSLARPGVPGRAPGVRLNWTYKVGSEWRPLGQSSSDAEVIGTSNWGFRDGSRAFTRNGEISEISFWAPAVWPRELFRTRFGRWLRVEIAEDGGPYTTLPGIQSLTVSYGWELPRLTGVTAVLDQPPAADLPPPSAFCNESPLDLSKDFYPFGGEPRFNDTFAVALPDALAQPDSVVTLTVTLTNPAGATDAPVPVVRTDGGPQVRWELWDGAGWRATSATYAFTSNGSVTFTLPKTIAPTVVNGDERYWLRARLARGDYGKAATYRKKDGTYEPVEATYAPPVVRSLSFTPAAAQPTPQPASACLSFNDFAYTDHSAVAAAGGQPFLPFTTGADTDPALYLGFDRSFDARPTTLYLQVEPPAPEEVAADQLAEIDPSTFAHIAWEYAGPDGWRPLGALDETGALAGRGLVHFIGPPDLVTRDCFGQRWLWLRARVQRGYFPLPPRLRRVLLNTTWATRVSTVEDEILGSSNGNPGQAFTTVQTPVQPDQQVTIREPQLPPAAEQASLSGGADAIRVTLDEAGTPDEIWVRWDAVGDFYTSGPRDRHYTIDALTGEIRFGDGRAGMVPPLGRNNIRVTYRTGGGGAGNRATGTVVELKSGIPYVDSVTNLEPAEGGAPREPIERLRARGPRVLRHRERALAAEDLADLAYAASTAVARVATVPPTLFDPYNLWLDPAAPSPTEEHARADAGRVGVIVVPNSNLSRPAPSLGLLRQVQAHLQARCPPTVDVWAAGPEWVRITVTTTAVPSSIEAADAVRGRVRTALERFLHPLTGGRDGQGWAFGRNPHDSDLFVVIEAVPGVDHVRSLTVARQPESEALGARLEAVLNQSLAQTSAHPPAPDLQRWLSRALVYSGQHEINLALESTE